MTAAQNPDEFFAAHGTIEDGPPPGAKPGPGARPKANGGGPDPVAAIAATPYVWRDPASLPPRRWLYGVHRLRQFLSVTVAPGGAGKSSLAIGEALAMASGRPLLGETVHERCRVWIWNGEDPKDELERRVAAACLALGVMPEEIAGRLFLDSGRDMPIVILHKSRDEILVAAPVLEAIADTVRANGIDALIVDPFVLTHSAPENDNGAIDRVAREWAKIADTCNCSVELVHHVRKAAAGQGEFTVEDGRGAVALIAAARSARVLNRMTKEEGERAGIEKHREFFRADNGKANLAPPAETSSWFKLQSVPLPNGDNVGAVVPWHWPSALDGVTVNDLLAVQNSIASGGDWRENSQAAKWAGLAVAEVLDLDHGAKADRAKISTLLKTWIDSGALKVVEADDDKRTPRKFIRVGAWVNT